MMTLRQFRAAEMRRVCSEYGASRSEFAEFYGDLRREWIQYLEAQAKGGAQFTKPVCRSIADNNCDLAYFEKFFRCVPRGVLFATGRNV